MNAHNNWLSSPGLAYQVAFDAVTTKADCSGSATLVLASSPLHARELVRRHPGRVELHLMGNWREDDIALRDTLGPEVDWERVHLAGDLAELTPSSFNTILWAAPEERSVPAIVVRLRPVASPEARLIVLGSNTRLSRFLPKPAYCNGHPANLVSVRHAVELAGWRPRQVYGFHGPFSLLWGVASRLSAMIDRDDLVDRCLAAMRHHFIVRGLQARWSPLWMILAEADGNWGQIVGAKGSVHTPGSRAVR